MAQDERDALLGQCLRHPDERVARLAELAFRLSAFHELIAISLRNYTKSERR